MCKQRAFRSRQTGQVQALQQRDGSRAGRHGAGGLPRHGGQGPAVRRGLPAPLRAQHAHPVRGGADRAHPGPLQLPRGLPHTRRAAEPEGERRRVVLAAGAAVLAGQRRLAVRVGPGVALLEEGRQLVHAAPAHRHQADRGLVQRDGGGGGGERPVRGK